MISKYLLMAILTLLVVVLIAPKVKCSMVVIVSSSVCY